MASSSKFQQDSFIDDDDLSCPLCVEEFDLSDRNFKPCPCGYQICQFCFNNIKNNMNGLCPACRRPYDDESIQFKVVTQEEIAQFKATVQRNAKKKAEQRNKEAQKREAESQNRKHLAGLRVVQKNLVYVVGLMPGIPENELLKTLRGPQYFGQYGPIVKIVVSKNKNGEPATSNNSLGVYVTFASKEDADKCIQAVNGSQNGDRVLRAQLGTTKYCSAYLRNETCTNKQCMFLHEPGDNDDSYSRQDLSTINSVNTQRPLQIPAYSSGPSVSTLRKEAISQAPQQIQPVAAATQPMVRDGSKDNSENADGSALPTTAGWAKTGQQSSRRQSVATSAATSSPAISASLPAPPPAEEVPESVDDESDHDRNSSSASSEPAPRPRKPAMDPVLSEILKSISYLSTIKLYDSSKKKSDVPYMPLWDDQGGLKRRLQREERIEAQRILMEQAARQEVAAERQAAASEVAEEQEPGSGSGQLGGEPEDDERDGGLQGSGFHDQRRPSSQLPIQRGSADAGAFGGMGTFSPNAAASINGRALTPQQQQQLMILKSSQPQSGFTDQYPPGIGVGGQSRLLQQQRDGRQLSRYNFTNEGPSPSKGVPNPKMLGQPQQAMGLAGNQFYPSSMPGPPPGLKSTGTPPNAMFGQQFGGSAFGTNKENNEVLREMMRNRGGMGAAGAGIGQSHDAGKLDLADPNILQSRMPHQQQSNVGIGQGLFGGQTQGGYNNQNMMYGGASGAFRGGW